MVVRWRNYFTVCFFLIIFFLTLFHFSSTEELWKSLGEISISMWFIDWSIRAFVKTAAHEIVAKKIMKETIVLQLTTKFNVRLLVSTNKASFLNKKRKKEWGEIRPWAIFHTDLFFSFSFFMLCLEFFIKKPD